MAFSVEVQAAMCVIKPTGDATFEYQIGLMLEFKMNKIKKIHIQNLDLISSYDIT